MKFSAYLIKDNGYRFTDLIKSNTDGRWFNLERKFEFSVSIFLGKCKVNNPTWLEFIKDVIKGEVEDELEEYNNSSTRAVILVKSEGYFVAYTLGFGRHLLIDYPIVRDFGVKVALNNINPKKLKGMDKLTISDNMMQSRQQSSKSVKVDEFDINTDKDFLRTVAGETISGIFDNKIYGSDSVQFSNDIEFKELGVLSNKLIKSYNSDDYKVHFSWYDNVQIERNKDIVEKLNKLLIDQFYSNDNLYLVPPEIVEDLYVDDMSFSEKGQKYPFNIDSVYEYFKSKKIDITIENLIKRNLFIHDQAGDLQYKWKLYNCLMTEKSYENNTYSLMLGTWFKINNDYLTEINNYLNGIEESTVMLVNCLIGEHEGQYNERAAQNNNNLLLMDKKLVHEIELCDLFSNERQLIHVKRWSSSSTMSHLFSQGRVSATLLNNDLKFRNDAKEKLKNLDSSFDFIDIDAYTSSDYEVVYAVIYPGNKSICDRLTFFSKVNMKQSVETLRGLGFKVSQIHIKQEI